MTILHLIYISTCKTFLTFETMFNEHIKILRDKENELLEIERNFQNKFTVFFTYETNKLPYNSFVEFGEDFYMQLTDKKLNSFTLAIENYNNNITIEFNSKLNLKNFFDKIQKVLNSSSAGINEISPNHAFGLIDKKEKIYNDKNDIETEKYECLVKENFLQKHHRNFLTRDNDFLIQHQLLKIPHFFLSNVNLNSKDFEFLLKIYNTQHLNLKDSRRSIGCIVFDIDKNKNKYYLDKFYNLCMSTKKNLIYPTIFSYLQHFNSTFFNTKNFENKSLLETSNLIFFDRPLINKTRKKNYHFDNFKGNQIEQQNLDQLKSNFRSEFQLNSLNFSFQLKH